MQPAEVQPTHVQPTWKPAPGQVALIELIDDPDQCVTGIIIGGDERELSVSLGTSPTPPAASSEVVASFFSPDALYRLRATVTSRPEQQSVIDLTVHDVQRVQRRTDHRVQIALPAALTGFDGTGRFAVTVGRTVDIGRGGCRIVTDYHLPHDIDPAVSVRLPDGHTIVATAHVLQTHADADQFTYRLAFVALPEGDAKRVAALEAGA